MSKRTLDRKMPFGKFTGHPIDAVPDWYVDWLRVTVPLREPLATWMEQEWGGTFKRVGDRTTVADELEGVDLRAVRRMFGARFHPDSQGGSREAMAAVNELLDYLEQMTRE